MVLVLDIGTSSMRAVLIDDNGRVIAKFQDGYELNIISEIEIEQNPNIVIDSVKLTLKEISKVIAKNKYKIDAISLTAQRSSVIPVDESCNPLHNAMMWQDTRTKDICNEFLKHEDEIFSICGMKVTTVFSASKILYFKRHKKQIYDKAYKLLGFQEYVLHFLTNKFITDTSIASRTLLFDITKLQWSQKLLNLFGIDKEKLCDLAPVGSVVANTTSQIKQILGIDYDIPVISAGGDQQCAALGLGCVNQSDVIANSGTGSYIIALSDKPVFDKEMRLNCNVSAIPDKWIIEGAVLGAGKVVDWVKNEFFQGDINIFTNACESTSIGANGVLFSPSFIGKGTPLWNPSMKGGIFNLGLHNKKEDFARALLEGISSDLKDCLDIVDEIISKKPTSVKISGGLTKNKVFNQIQSDMFLREVIKTDNSESTAIGAFISAKKALNPDLSYDEIVNNIQISEMYYYPQKESFDKYCEINRNRKLYESVQI